MWSKKCLGKSFGFHVHVRALFGFTSFSPGLDVCPIYSQPDCQLFMFLSTPWHLWGHTLTCMVSNTLVHSPTLFLVNFGTLPRLRWQTPHHQPTQLTVIAHSTCSVASPHLAWNKISSMSTNSPSLGENPKTRLIWKAGENLNQIQFADSAHGGAMSPFPNLVITVLGLLPAC